jgi:hypothetical protein
MMWNQFRYYQSELKFSWQLVVSIAVGATSILQWLYWESSHKQALARIKQTPTYKNRLKALEYEQLQLVCARSPTSGDSNHAEPRDVLWLPQMTCMSMCGLFLRASH